jgi:hypothetical protein
MLEERRMRVGRYAISPAFTRVFLRRRTSRMSVTGPVRPEQRKFIERALSTPEFRIV